MVGGVRQPSRGPKSGAASTAISTLPPRVLVQVMAKASQFGDIAGARAGPGPSSARSSSPRLGLAAPRCRLVVVADRPRRRVNWPFVGPAACQMASDSRGPSNPPFQRPVGERGHGRFPRQPVEQRQLITSVLPPDPGETLCISRWTGRASVRLPPRCDVLLKFRAAEDFPANDHIFPAWPRDQMAIAPPKDFEKVFCREKRIAFFGTCGR